MHRLVHQLHFQDVQEVERGLVDKMTSRSDPQGSMDGLEIELELRTKHECAVTAYTIGRAVQETTSSVTLATTPRMRYAVCSASVVRRVDSQLFAVLRSNVTLAASGGKTSR